MVVIQFYRQPAAQVPHGEAEYALCDQNVSMQNLTGDQHVEADTGTVHNSQ